VKILALAFGLWMFAGLALAADVDGKWTGSVSTPNGDIPQTFNFKAEGADLTGSMVNFDGSSVAIKDGKVDGSNISFSVSLDFGGNQILLKYKGVVDKDQIKLTGDFMGMPFELVVKKSA